MSFKVSIKTKNTKGWRTLHPAILYKRQAEGYAEHCKERWPDLVEYVIGESSDTATHTFANGQLCPLGDDRRDTVDDWIAAVNESFRGQENIDE